jgi:hypothetical protein
MLNNSTQLFESIGYTHPSRECAKGMAVLYEKQGRLKEATSTTGMLPALYSEVISADNNDDVC